MEQDNEFLLLATKDVYAILDGDTELGTSDSPLKMPYLSGTAIVELSNKFGLPCKYGSLSRWMYMDELFKHCIENDRVEDLLAYIFNGPHFGSSIEGLGVDEAKNKILLIRSRAIDRINALLYLSGYELRIVANKFILCKEGSSASVEAPAIKTINREYVSSLAERINHDIDNQELDSAITKSRTLLEEVFIYVIDAKGETPVDKGQISKLYGQVKSLYNMHQSKDMDTRFNMLLSGLEKIVSAVSEMRNKNSDAHGVGLKRVAIKDYHARLMANSAIAMAEFILSVANNANGKA